MKQHSKILLLCVSLCVPISNTIAKPMALTTRAKIVASSILSAACTYFVLDRLGFGESSPGTYFKNTAVAFSAGFAAWKYYAQTPHGRLFRAHQAEQKISQIKFKKIRKYHDKKTFMKNVEQAASEDFFKAPLILENIIQEKNNITFIRDMIAHIRNDAASDPDLIEECASLEETINTIEPTTNEQLAWIRSFPNIQAFYKLLLERKEYKDFKINTLVLITMLSSQIVGVYLQLQARPHYIFI